MKPLAEPKPSFFPVRQDHREQLPFTLATFGFPVEVGHLETGDYQFRDFADVVLERKSVPDLVGCCCGDARDRFEAEQKRMLGFRHRVVIVEGSWEDLEAANWRSQVKPQSVIGSVLAWMGEGIPFLLAGNRERAETYAARWLFNCARRRYRELRGIIVGIEDSQRPARMSPNAVDPSTALSFAPPLPGELEGAA